MSYPDAAWERAMTVQEVMLKALKRRAALVPRGGHPGVVARGFSSWAHVPITGSWLSGRDNPLVGCGYMWL